MNLCQSVCIVLARQVISVQLVRKYLYVPRQGVFNVFWGGGVNLRPYSTELNLNLKYFYTKRYSQIRLSGVSDVISRASGSPNFSAEENSFFTSSMCYAEKSIETHEALTVLMNIFLQEMKYSVFTAGLH